MYRDHKKVNSKGAFGTQASGIYREVVYIQRSKSNSKGVVFMERWSLYRDHKKVNSKELLGPNHASGCYRVQNQIAKEPL